MSRTAGVFSETILQNIRLKAKEMSFDDRIMQQYRANADILTHLKDLQTAKISALERKDKTQKITVEWINSCGLTAQDNVSCVIGGAELSTNTQDYELDYEKIVPFTVDDAELDDNDFNTEDVVAKGFLKADKALCEIYAQYATAQLNAFKGVNQLNEAGSVLNVSGSDTYIDAPYWNAELLAKLQRAGVINKFTNPALISGSNLYEDDFLSKYNAANANGKGNAGLFNAMNVKFDLFNIDQVNTPSKISYLVSTGAVALASKTRFSKQVVTYTDRLAYSIDSVFVPGLSFDVYYKNECGTNDFMKHNFKVVLRAGIFNNPEECVENNTGVLTLVCGTPS